MPQTTTAKLEVVQAVRNCTHGVHALAAAHRCAGDHVRIIPRLC
jgi:hypothetical protein